MLAKLGEPFDSDEHLFEIKWDGFRAVTLIEGGAHRIWSRRQLDFTPRFPELGFLSTLPEGLALDGELVLLKDGRADFQGLLQRNQARDELRIEALARSRPVTYVVFDLMYQDFASCMDEPLTARRERLARVVGECGEPRLVMSEAVIGQGLETFEKLRSLSFEGMVAKRLDSTYEPGMRTGAWTKCKVPHYMHCAIVGYLDDEDGEVRSLIIATDDPEGLKCVGRVGSGLTAAMRKKLTQMLLLKRREKPLIDCGMEGAWVEPGLYCKVRYMERTSNGTLRAPVFLELISEET